MTHETRTPPRKWPAMKLGFKGLCPKCGHAKLFKAYLKPVDACPSCSKHWVDVRADDGPAWATILIVGHVLAPFFHFFMFKTDLPDWAPFLILSAAAILLILLLLPRIKGAFMGLIWATGAPTS